MLTTKPLFEMQIKINYALTSTCGSKWSSGWRIKVLKQPKDDLIGQIDTLPSPRHEVIFKVRYVFSKKGQATSNWADFVEHCSPKT